MLSSDFSQNPLKPKFANCCHFSVNLAPGQPLGWGWKEVFSASQQLKKAIGVRRTEMKSIQEGRPWKMTAGETIFFPIVGNMINRNDISFNFGNTSQGINFGKIRFTEDVFPINRFPQFHYVSGHAFRYQLPCLFGTHMFDPSP